ncbi:tripartite tricarboxylate transporter substrate binding protein [Pseudorhodoplanes sp.]|jgi:tripartite-type tricarboxylate transporter receptor subunit TctC|uniref:Bug family tripartite tricarboxylate transporter substrate binding protein n=1 Tax=Pseudorhodoplanes sp. TaxID=1934341 RepID=UPI002C7580CA|nr:tripartite tricarboxylate transporter substrate binding protein [Pseudorhodoplanes sp.]HWV41389.1 tripartite tricarboxylate transporter substrate binding protein [Pseudorhodoplanes sp.]
MSFFARFAATIAVALLSSTVLAGAQGYPNRPIKWIVSFPPGGSTDVVARAMLPSLEKRLGQPVVIENRGGAGGNIGTDAVAKSAPDGYTIGFSAAGALTVNPTLMEKVPFNVEKDLVPVTLVGTSPFLLVASPKAPTQSLSEVIAAAKAKPGELSIGHGGNGTAMHLTAALLNQMGGISTTLVPYRGSGPVTADVVAGHIPLGITDAPSAIGQIKGGAVKPLGVTSLKRTPSLPDVPTFDELGLKGYESIGWYGVIAPAGTPPDIIAKLNAAFVETLKEPEVAERIRSVGAEPSPMTPAQFDAFIKAETKKWANVIKTAGIKASQ